MGWSEKKTSSMLIFLLILVVAFAVSAILLILHNFRNKEMNSQFLKSFTYLVATTFGTGLGCIWFRICRSKSTFFHVLIHAITFMCMLIAYKDVIHLIFDGEIAECYNWYPISMLSISIYTAQFILSFHFVVFRSGQNPREEAFNSGLHAFIGAITLFACITDGILVCHKIAKQENLENEGTFALAAICMFLFAMSVWYVILNPYFDWRRFSTTQRNQNTELRY